MPNIRGGNKHVLYVDACSETFLGKTKLLIGNKDKIIPTSLPKRLVLFIFFNTVPAKTVTVLESLCVVQSLKSLEIFPLNICYFLWMKHILYSHTRLISNIKNKEKHNEVIYSRLK